VTDGTTNASLPQGGDPETLTVEEAVNLLAERAAKGPAKGRRAKRAPKAAKKEAAPKAAKKKTTRKKAAGAE
jgi:DNA topoisomerase-1